MEQVAKGSVLAEAIERAKARQLAVAGDGMGVSTVRGMLPVLSGLDLDFEEVGLLLEHMTQSAVLNAPVVGVDASVRGALLEMLLVGALAAQVAEERSR